MLVLRCALVCDREGALLNDQVKTMSDEIDIHHPREKNQ